MHVISKLTTHPNFRYSFLHNVNLLTALYLHPAEPPPAITVEGNVTASPGSRAVLTCHVISTVNFNLTWLRGGHDASLDPRVHILSNLSLQVSSVTPDQSGWYECVAINEGGVKAEQIYLTVQGEEFVFTLVCVLWSDVDAEKHFFLPLSDM